MSENTTIQMISVDRLHPHPDNPRKDVGDVSELAKSIQANGILQNLTVVPYFSKVHGRKMDGLYTVIIGHRRLAAAKLAGLEEIPCTVAEMSEKEQLSTMLTENMQRVDLSVYEQAQGFQMMLDLGDSAAEIAKKAGFSESTVRRRLEIAKLDEKEFKKASCRQISIGEFDELAKVNDIHSRNRLLKSIGTPNFKSELKNALDEQKLTEKMEEWLEAVKEFAVEIKDGDGNKWLYADCYGRYTLNSSMQKPKDCDSVQYGYKRSQKDITLFKKADLSLDARREAEREEKRQREEAERLQWEEINERHFDLRCDFVKSLSNGQIKKHSLSTMGFVAETMHKLSKTYTTREADIALLAYLLGIKIDDGKAECLLEVDGVRSALESIPEKALFALAFAIRDNERNGYWRKVWNGVTYLYQHQENEALSDLYALLEELGYEMSDEEKEMQSGDHELFLP